MRLHGNRWGRQMDTRSFIVLIDGSEAIPVRVIPLLIKAKVLNPHNLMGHLLRGEITAYQLEGEIVRQVYPEEWQEAAVQIEILWDIHKVEHRESQEILSIEVESIRETAFVWRDEFEQFFRRVYGPYDSAGTKYYLNMRPAVMRLDYSPAVAIELKKLVMRGFLDAQGVTYASVADVALPTACDEPAPTAFNSKKWTDDRLAELKAFRDAHTMVETAKKFGISEQRIRQLLPVKKSKAKLFAGLVHRTK